MSGYVLPPELDQPLPRRVRITGLVKTPFKVLSVLFGVVFLFTAILTVLAFRDESLLKNRGVATDAQVTTLTFEPASGKSHPHPSYLVTYQFTPAATANTAPSPRVPTRATSEAQFRKLFIGQDVPILYDPDDPNRSDLNFDDALHGTSALDQAKWLFKFCLFLGAGYLIFVVYSFFGCLRERKLLRWGTPAKATILEEKEIPGTGKSPPKLDVAYQFIDARGQTMRDRQERLKIPLTAATYFEIEAREHNPTALYDPKNSANSLLYPSDKVVCLPPK